MSDTSQIDPASDEPRDLRSRLGAEANRATEAERRAEAAERRAAIAEAGLPEFPGKQFFLGAYAGEPTPEAVKQAAAEAGFINADGSPIGGAPAQQQVSQEELDRQRQIVSASSGAQTPSSGDIDLAVALRNCKSQAEVMAIVAQMAGNPGFKSREGLIGVLPEF